MLRSLWCRLVGHDWQHSRDWRECARCETLVADRRVEDVSVEADRVRGRP